jgi:dihydropteroate synthase
MGVLNVTPDSFATERPFVVRGVVDVPLAVEEALRMEADGADIVDVGGESTRPGSDSVSEEEECARVLPVVEALAGRLAVPISVDTSKSIVARAALDRGAAIVNDVSGLQYDPALGPVVAEGGAALILMHMRGKPQSMYAAAAYDDLIAEVSEEVRTAIGRASAAGVPPGQVVVDPGIGFAKRPEHSYGVLAGLPRLAAALGRPVLVGPSRKSFLRAAIGDRPAADRDWGTAAAVAAAVLAGAHVVRVHAVAQMVQTVRVAEEIRRAGMVERPDGGDIPGKEP